MDKIEISRLLELFSKGEMNQDEMVERISSLGLEELGFATIDTDRSSRTGIPEVIYSEGKTPEQVTDQLVMLFNRITGQ